ncbi:hypothetical protein WJ970_09005 [Achromobacter xylosoxidans]
MMNNSRTIFFALCFCLLAAVAMPVAAQSAGYTKLNVKGRVQLEVPGDWTISDAEQRRRVKEFSEKMTGVAIDHVASLSVQSYPAPPGCLSGCRSFQWNRHLLKQTLGRRFRPISSRC